MMGINEGEEVQVKCINDIFNKRTGEKFSQLEKERVIQVQETFKTLKQHTK
jgi:hypothetical protein